jgi:CubicO group peptidase (beta-lactamase class C family)
MKMQEIMLGRRQFLGSLGLAGTALVTPAWAAKAARGVSANWPAIQAVLDDWVKAKRIPGATAAIARGLDQAVFMSAGTQSFDDPTAMTPDSLFRAYSQTKVITGMAAMMLIEDGKLGMDQNIADLIPAFANPRVLIDPTKDLQSRPAAAPITVRTLLTHTAGLGYSIVTKGPLLDAYNKTGIAPAQVSRATLPGFPAVVCAPTLEEFANRLGTLPLIADPGRKWSYSVSLDLMGRVIEIASGMSFDAFLMQRIFKPLGMTSSFFQVPASEAKRLTTNHFLLNTMALPIDPAKSSIYLDKPPFAFGGAGLVTTARDWDRFQLMLLGEGKIGQTRVMKTETARWGMSNLLHPDTKVEGFVAGQGFGAGGRVTIKAGAGEGIGTYGWGGAASTIGWVDRTRQVRASGWIQLMTQGNQSFPTDIAKAVYASLPA